MLQASIVQFKDVSLTLKCLDPSLGAVNWTNLKVPEARLVKSAFSPSRQL